jgi:hypothetical protein
MLESKNAANNKNKRKRIPPKPGDTTRRSSWRLITNGGGPKKEFVKANRGSRTRF